MPTVRVQIQPPVLNWLFQYAEDQHLPKDIFDKLEQIKANDGNESYGGIEKLSRRMHIPFGYFFLNNAPEDTCEIAEYRTIKSKGVQRPSRELIDTSDRMYKIQEWTADYRKKNGDDPYSFVCRYHNLSDAKQIAQDIRVTLNIDINWFETYPKNPKAYQTIKKLVSNAGIMVYSSGIAENNTRRPLDVNEFRAFSIIDSYAPLIFINKRDTYNARLFSLFHELAHIWIGTSSLYNNSDVNPELNTVSKEEILCNAAAAEILIPAVYFNSKWQEISGTIEQKIQHMAAEFPCSKSVIARRALDLKKITQFQYQAVTKALMEDNKALPEKNGSGGNYYANLNSSWDHHFIIALDSATKSGQENYSEIYRLTKIKADSFAELVSNIESDGSI